MLISTRYHLLHFVINTDFNTSGQFSRKSKNENETIYMAESKLFVNSLFVNIIDVRVYACSMYVVLSGRLSVYQLPVFGDNIRTSGPVIQPNRPLRRQLGKLQSVLGKCTCSGHSDASRTVYITRGPVHSVNVTGWKLQMLCVSEFMKHTEPTLSYESFS